MGNDAAELMLSQNPIRVMIVDDSAIVRGFVTKMIEGDPGVTLVASVQSAQVGLDTIDKKDVEVVLLDIEMPGMTGLEVLPKLLQKKPDLQVIMASTLTLRNAEISLKAVNLGAVDYIPKPSSTGLFSNTDFKKDLLEKIKDWGLAKRRGTTSKMKAPVNTTVPGHSFASPASPKIKRDIKLAPTNNNLVVDIIAIGSSTGGPQALTKVFNGLQDAKIEQPIFITQHMPPAFTKILAEHIGKAGGGKKCVEGADGMQVEKGCIYVAPGGKHMTIEKNASGEGQFIKLIDTPPENFCKPSVEPMIRSLVKIFQGRMLEVILTGMGNDGHQSAADVVKAGGNLIAQDEETSIVWGMPGAVAMAGLCSSVLPLEEIAPYIKKVAARR